MSIENLVTEKFGPLQGVKIVSTGTLIAQPFAAELAAEMGAEVIQIERPGIGDVGWRNIGIRLASQRRQIRRRDDLDPGTPQRILHLARFVEAARPRNLSETDRARRHLDGKLEAGHLPQWGLDDAAIWQVNPKLVITHVSGFGQTGDPDYVHRASYDVVGQAVGGMMYPDRLSRSDSADARRAVDRRLHDRAVHDVVVARRR